MHWIQKFTRRFPHAIRGLSYAAVHDFGVRSQLYVGAAVAMLVSVFLQPLTKTELLFTLFAWALVLITELQNSALEASLDKLHPDRHEAIKRSKDMAAGAVLVAALLLASVLVVLIYTRVTM